MRQTLWTRHMGALLAASAVAASTGSAVAQNVQGVEFRNPTGKSASFSTSGAIDLSGTFFQSLGTNGRTCGTCHLPSDGWSLSARTAQTLFDQTGGLHPLFAFDGHNGPGLDRSTVEARRSASSLMLDRGLVRLMIGPLPGFPVPEYQFEVTAADSTYGNPVAIGGGGPPAMVVFRRPLPTANFDTLGTAFWTGMADALPLDVVLQLSFQLATQLHAQAPTFTPTPAQVGEVFGLMRGVPPLRGLSNAQIKDDEAKELTYGGAFGGPAILPSLALTGTPGFNLYDPWANLAGGGASVARRAVARGQAVFNTKCAGCHSTPNRGDSAAAAAPFINLGLSDASRRTPGMPLYTLRCVATNGVCTYGDIKQTTDPGRAMVTGRWADIGRFKVPNLRGLAAREPYFHNGFAKTLPELVEFYNTSRDLRLNSQDKADLVYLLRAL